MKQILFICTHNSARSQMAEALVNANLPNKYQAFSAGTTATTINPYVVKALNEIGIDAPQNKNQKASTCFKEKSLTS